MANSQSCVTVNSSCHCTRIFLSQIDVVSCNINGHVYVRKSIEKRFAFKTREVSLIPLLRSYNAPLAPCHSYMVYLCSNATPNWSERYFFVLSAPTRSGLRISYVLSKPVRTSISSWTTWRVARFGMSSSQTPLSGFMRLICVGGFRR
jgi:hypothetical protein